VHFRGARIGKANIHPLCNQRGDKAFRSVHRVPSILRRV
jgi:hypothetical protein